MVRTPAIAAAVGTIALLSLGLASPAVAGGAPRALPAGDYLYATLCPLLSDDAPAVVPDLQLASVDTLTAGAYAIGSGTSLPDTLNCAAQGAWDPATGAAYGLSFNGTTTTLVKLDLATGASTAVAPIELAGTPVLAHAMAIGYYGTAYAIVASELYQLDLTDGSLTAVAAITDANIYAFALDPVTDGFYVINSTGDLSSIDMTTGALTSLGSVGVDADNTFSLQIDSSGIFWVGSGLGTGPFSSNLWSFDRSDVTTTGQFSGLITMSPAGYSATPTPYTSALLISSLAPPPPVAAPVVPALASTGLDTTPDAWLAGGAALLLLAGVGAVVSRRRRTATS